MKVRFRHDLWVILMRGLRSGGAWNQEAFYAPIWLAFENGKEDACRDCHRRTQRISYKVKGNRGKESGHRSKASSACSSAMAREGHLPHEPAEALRSSPGLLWTLEEEIIQSQRHGRQSEA